MEEEDAAEYARARVEEAERRVEQARLAREGPKRRRPVPSTPFSDSSAYNRGKRRRRVPLTDERLSPHVADVTERYPQIAHYLSEQSIGSSLSKRRTGSSPTARRYLSYDNDDESKSSANSSSRHGQGGERALPLFSRYKDPTVRKAGGEHEESRSTTLLAPTPARALSPPFSVETATAESLYKRLYGEPASKDSWDRVRSELRPDGMVDLTQVEDVSSLETVEGDDIFNALMATSTPRVNRSFPAEGLQTASEEREQNFLRRRRAALRKKYSVQQMTERWEVEAEHFMDKVGVASPHTPINLKTTAPVSLERRSARLNSVSTPDFEQQMRLEIEKEDGSEAETTEAIFSHMRHIKDITWRYFFLWFLAATLLLCTVVVSAPYMRRLLEKPVAYCDSDWSLADSEIRAIDAFSSFNQATALQPFVVVTAMVERPSCQPCPLYGNCLNGELISCSPPYEIHHGVCVENPDVSHDLARIADGIEQYVISRVAASACQNVTVWNYFAGEDDVDAFDLATPIKVLISELREFVASTIHYGSAVLDLPRDYVFHRALDMALRNLREIFVGDEPDRIYAGTALAPWKCQAKHQLYSHVPVITVALLVSTFVGFLYRRYVISRNRKQLIDRLYKEARFFLLRRADKPNRCFPADHLRENLFDTYAVPPGERQRMRKSVWPKVIALLDEDSRVRSQQVKVDGKEMVALEWVSSTSPTNNRSSNRPRRDRRSARKSLPARTSLP